MNFLTLDVGGTAIKSAFFQNDELLFSNVCPSEAKSGGNRVFEVICSIIDETLRQYLVDGIGISTAGQVDSTKGIIVYANENIPNYTGMQLKKMLENRYYIPTIIENDVNAAALGEAFYGAGKKESDFLCLTYGTGIGGAIILNQHLYKGSSGYAAEMGHMITHPGGLRCGCNNRGCYEQYASTTALVRMATKVNPSYYNGRVIFEALERNEEAAQNVIDAWIHEISYGIINLIYIFNPSRIVLGGGIMAQPYILTKLQEIVLEQTVSTFHNVTLCSAKLGNLAGVYGMKHLLETSLE